MNRKDRFKNRKKKLDKIRNTIVVNDDIDEDLVQKFLTSKIDEKRVKNTFESMDEYYTFAYDFEVSKEEAKEFLEEFKKEFSQEKFDKLIGDCKREVINSIVTPFGLGKVVAVYDKVGGNVTTIHNANQKIYANKEDEYRREDYTNTKNSNGEQFAGNSKKSVGSKFTKSQMDNDGNVIDAYSGKKQKANTTSPDHIESLSQYHKDGGFMQSKTQKADFGTDEDNLALTDRSINQSMRDFDKKEWMEKEANGLKNKDRFDIDEKELNKAIARGKKTAEKHLPTDKEKVNYYLNKSATTGVNEGAKMGMQQALGLVMTEFFTALFDEILDIYKNGYFNGFGDDKFFTILKERLKRISLKIKDKWKDVAIAFKDGFLSGFISNLVTTVINAFVTTGKRVVRIIREGIFSLFRAIKLLLFPPKGMSFEDAMHEAKKLIASGLIISLGVIAEEYIDKLIRSTGALSPFADILTTVFVGAITGLAVTMVVYHIDKKKNDKEMINALIAQTDNKFDNIEKLLGQLEVIRVV